MKTIQEIELASVVRYWKAEQGGHVYYGGYLYTYKTRHRIYEVDDLERYILNVKHT